MIFSEFDHNEHNTTAVIRYHLQPFCQVRVLSLMIFHCLSIILLFVWNIQSWILCLHVHFCMK